MDIVTVSMIAHSHIIVASMWFLKSLSFLEKLNYTEDVHSRVRNVTKCEYLPASDTK